MESKGAVEQVVRWMRQNLDAEVSMEQLAERVGVSPFHFLRTFRRFTGVTPALFLSALRLEEAKRLLLTTERSVTDICFDVGFNSLGTFTTRFTQLVGLSPARLRHLGSGFRLESPAMAERLAAVPPAAGSIPVTGTLGAGDPPSGLIFLGLFSQTIPQQRPLACTLLAAPGPFRLNAPGPGTYYLFAACFSRTSDPRDFLLASRAVRQVASGGPLTLGVGGDGPPGPVNLHLRPLTALDPPLLVALPLLMAERRARANLRIAPPDLAQAPPDPAAA